MSPSPTGHQRVRGSLIHPTNVRDGSRRDENSGLKFSPLWRVERTLTASNRRRFPPGPHAPQPALRKSSARRRRSARSFPSQLSRRRPGRTEAAPSRAPRNPAGRRPSWLRRRFGFGTTGASALAPPALRLWRRRRFGFGAAGASALAPPAQGAHRFCRTTAAAWSIISWRRSKPAPGGAASGFKFERRASAGAAGAGTRRSREPVNTRPK